MSMNHQSRTIGAGKGYREIRCDCGNEITAYRGADVTCACGRDFNCYGQLLAPRSQWEG